MRPVLSDAAYGNEDYAHEEALEMVRTVTIHYCDISNNNYGGLLY